MIPEGVTSIGDAAFYYCTGLTSITIPEGITSIKQRTFHKCTSLTSITIPEGVTSIGKWAFKECSSLTSIILPSTFSSWGQETLLDTNLQAAFFDKNATNNTFPTNVGLTNPESVNRWLYEVLTPASAAPDNKTHVKISGHPGGSATSIKDSAMGDNFVIDDIISSVTLNHDLPSTPDPAVEATCTEPGHIEGYTCKGCGRHFSDIAATTEISEENWITATATGHIEPLEHHAAVAATCTTDGNSEYWYCSQCGKYFNDADGENEIEEGSWVTPAEHSLTAHPAADATCTEPGNSAYWSCNGCGKYFSDASAGTEITEDSWITATAIGHIEPLEHHAAVAATCTEAGNMEYWYCSRCEKYFSDAEGENEIAENEQVIAATGHDWGEVSYTWAGDNTTCTATRVCGRNAEHVETETADTTNEITTSATCTEAGVKTYTATFTNTAFKTQTKEKETPIAPNAHKFPLLSEERVEPTCTEPGHVEGYTCSLCKKHFSDAEATQEIPENEWTIAATGHDWTEPAYKWSADKSLCAAKRECNTCNRVEAEAVDTMMAAEIQATCTQAGSRTHTAMFTNSAFTISPQTETIPATKHNLTYHPATEATCTAQGNIEYRECAVCHKYFSDAEGTQEIEENQLATPMDSAAHSWGKVAYTWTPDNSTCTAKRVCGRNAEHVETETIDATNAVTKPATCTKTGVKTYTATFEDFPEFNESEERIKTETIEIDPTAHLWGEVTYTWSDDKTTCTATRTCANDSSHTESVNGTVESAVKTPASCTNAGEKLYIASFENEAFATQINPEEIPATGHTWSDEWSVGDGKHWHECTVCHDAKSDEEEHVLVHEESQDPTNEADGHAAGYTCSVCGKHFSNEESTQEISAKEWIIPKKNGILGDINGDGSVDAQDMQMIFDIITGKLQ